ncbi:unnamed protein product [Schistosoma turkestanicum]|nr:unnamed protein product [Schistosoma turkestanicum]
MINCGRNYLTKQLQLDPEEFFVHHLHMHIIGPKQSVRLNPMFDSRFRIFRQTEKVLDDLKKQKHKRTK